MADPRVTPDRPACPECAAARLRDDLLVATVRKHMNDHQRASFDEEWQFICRQRGFSYSPPPRPPAGQSPAPPCETI